MVGVAEKMGDMEECPRHSVSLGRRQGWEMGVSQRDPCSSQDLYSLFMHKALDEFTYQSEVSEGDLCAKITELHRANRGEQGAQWKGSGFAQQFQVGGGRVGSI